MFSQLKIQSNLFYVEIQVFYWLKMVM